MGALKSWAIPYVGLRPFRTGIRAEGFLVNSAPKFRVNPPLPPLLEMQTRDQGRMPGKDEGCQGRMKDEG